MELGIIDVSTLGFVIIVSFPLLLLVFSVFKWGYEKEKRGERTDIFGNKFGENGNRFK